MSFVKLLPGRLHPGRVARWNIFHLTYSHLEFLPCWSTLRWSIAGILFSTVLFCLRAYGDTPGPCSRIISLAPSVTEVLYELGLGSQVVAVTRYDAHPPEVEKLPKIGGFLDPATEAIIALKPNIVFGLGDSASLVALLARLGIAYEKVDHNRLQGLHESIIRIGQICDVPNRGHELKERLLREEQAIGLTSEPQSQPRILVLVGRGEAGDSPGGVFVSGSDGFYADIIKLAGGRVAFNRKTTPLVGIAEEGVFAINPEIIIEFVGRKLEEVERRRVAESWSSLQRLFAKAGRTVRVEIVDGEEVVIPGPRYTALIRRVRELLQ